MILPLLVCLVAALQEPNLRGTVILPDGSPAAGIEVKEASCVASGFAFNATQTTDAYGSFAFIVARPQTCCAAYVFAKAPGTALGWISVSMPTKNLPIVLRLRKPAELAGHIVDGFGKPISGAKVSVATIQLSTEYDSMGNLGDYNGAASRLPEFNTESASDGSYRFQDVPEGAECTITVAAKGHSQIKGEYGMEPTVQAGDKDVTIAMLGKLSGSASVVLNGSPAAGARLITGEGDSVEADAQGRCRFSMSEGAGPVWARSADGKYVSAPVVADLASSKPSVVRLDLKPAVLLKGKLIGFPPKKTPKTIEISRTVFLSPSGDDDLEQTEEAPVRPDGSFSLMVEPKGIYEGRASVTNDLVATGSISFEDGPQTAEIMEVRYFDEPETHPDKDVRCKVTDTSGNPVDGARVIALGMEWYGDTTPDGMTTTKVHKGQSLIATNAERTQYSAPVLYKGQSQVDLKLASTPILSGRVVDEKGSGVPYASIDVIAYGDDVPGGRHGSEWTWIEADREGKYSIALPAAIELRLGFKAPGFVERYTERFRNGHTSTTRPDDRLERAKFGVRGVVVNNEGKAVPGLPVEISWTLWGDNYTIPSAGGGSSGGGVMHPKWVWAYTRSDGTFEFPKLWDKSGSMNVTATHPYYGEVNQQVNLGDTVKVVLEGPSRRTRSRIRS